MTRMRALGVATTITILTFAAAGCSSTTAPAAEPVAEATAESTPTPPPPNRAACAQFNSEFTTAMGVLTADETTVDDWDAAGDEFDVIALQAEGDVKERLQTLVSDWPDFSDLVIYGDWATIDDLTMPVVRACEAEGYTTSSVFSLEEATQD
jgi:hypothetical protein